MKLPTASDSVSGLVVAVFWIISAADESLETVYFTEYFLKVAYLVK